MITMDPELETAASPEEPDVCHIALDHGNVGRCGAVVPPEEPHCTMGISPGGVCGSCGRLVCPTCLAS